MMFSQSTKKIFQKAGILLSGNAVSAVFSLITIAFMTRALSLEDFGRYALVTALIALIDRLVSFQSWQALIHFGAKASEAGDSGKLISLFAFGWYLDVITGIVGYALILLLGLFVPHWFGLEEHAVLFTAVAGFLVLFNWTAAPTAIFRLYDKFYLQALYQKVTTGTMMLCTFFLWLMNENNILLYVVALTFSGLTGKVFFYAMAVRELRHQRLLNIDKIDILDLIKTTPRLWKFVITTNLDGVVRVFRDIDIFIINAILGPASVALYKVARTLTKAFGKVTGPFFQVIYPELNKLCAANKMADFVTLMKQSSKSLGVAALFAWLAFLVLGDTLLEHGLGQDYSQAYGVTLLCMAAMVVWATAMPLSPAMIALGKVETTLFIHVTTTVMYLLMLVVFCKGFGLLGSGVALLVFFVLWALAMFFSFRCQPHHTPSHERSD